MFKIMVSGFLFLLFPLCLQAGGVFLYEIGSAEVRLAAAGWAARAQDPSTLFTNPAGMSRIQNSTGQLGIEPIYGNVKFEPNSKTTVKSHERHADSWIPSGSFYYVQPLGTRFTIGVGSLGYFGSKMKFNDGWVGRYYVDKITMQGFSLVPAVSYKVSKWLSVGLAANIMYGTLYQKVAINNRLDGTCDGRLKIKADDISAGWIGGILVDLSCSSRFGIQYLSCVRLDLEDVPGFKNIGPRLQFILDRTGLACADVKVIAKVPQMVMFSAYHDVTCEWTFMWNVGWQQWSKFQKVSISLVDPNATTLTFLPKYQDTWHVAMGLEYHYDCDWTISGGIAYDSSAVNNKSRPLDFPVGKQLRIGSGARWHYSDFIKMDFCYELMWSGNLPVNVNRGTLASRVDGKFRGLAFQFLNFNLTWIF